MSGKIYLIQDDDTLATLVETSSCPKCGAEMVERIAKSGKNVGNRFWGCSNYPQCRGIVNIEEPKVEQ